MPGNLQPIRIPVSGCTSVAFTHLSWHSSKQIAAKQISEAKLKDTRIKYARTKNANAKNFVFKGGLVGAIRLPSNGTLKTKEKESGNLIVRAMPFILNFHTQMSSSQLEERKIFSHVYKWYYQSESWTMFFFPTHEKNDTSKQSHSSALIWCQNSAFCMTLQRLRLASCFAVFQRGNLLCLETRAFFRRKGSNSSEIGKE